MTRRLARGARLVVASHNPGKIAEIRDLVAGNSISVVSAADLGLAEPEETGATFEANAALKALAAARAAGLPALSDDFGTGGRPARRRPRRLLGALGRPTPGLQGRNAEAGG